MRALGYPEGPVISVALGIVRQHCKHQPREQVLALLQAVLDTPAAYAADPLLAPVAAKLLPAEPSVLSLNQGGAPFRIFGAGDIEQEALHQMYTAAKLPIAVAGALLPDAHSGYGLPIGGVLATEGTVIPYGVGVDIGCRMCLSIYELPPEELDRRTSFFVQELDAATLFGSGAQFERPSDHPVMEDDLFYRIPLLKQLHGKAWKQLGSSGSGNHFAEFGIVHLPHRDPVLDMSPGNYLGLLSHSGSRALGAAVAQHYTKLAMSKRRLPQEARHLAWLELAEEDGSAYWEAMSLAGDYASACHHVLHDKITRRLGLQPLRRVQNHHNFAWKETLHGREVIVHRKGATPAGRDVLGIIPGSMTASGFLVRGKGVADALYSASHGAGRRMSRSQVLQNYTRRQLLDVLEEHGVTLLGGGLDEAPFAYKDIHTVMQHQQELVDVVGTFTPRIVKMDGAAPKPWQEKKKKKG